MPPLLRHSFSLIYWECNFLISFKYGSLTGFACKAFSISLTMLRKSGVFLLTLFTAIIAAGIFGILHDEITYSISPEYFTKFKFLQFQVGEAVPYRSGAAIVGFKATWWTGLLIGFALGIVGFLFPDYKMMRKNVFKGLGIIFITTILISFTGFLLGKFYLSNHPPASYFPVI